MRISTGFVFLTVMLFGVVVFAQDHWTEGPVWACSAYRIKEGQFDNYMKYIRQDVLPQNEESKKAGLALDFKTFVKDPADPKDWDIMYCTLFASYGKALDYSADDRKKADEIAAKHFKTADQDKQRETTDKRFQMREFLGTTYVREVQLKPITP